MSTILVNTLTGTSTAGSIAVTGEGNSTTTNLQQGLAKMWAHSDSSAAASDSLNVSSTTDPGTGRYQFAFANAMNNADYCGPAISNQVHVDINGTPSTSVFEIITRGIDHSSVDADNTMCVLHGDLA
tara:strand:+ start:129 stop:509 length:381 start_codon:yes stop_codon:yes gene_type:complete